MITRDDLNWWLEKEAQLDWQFAISYAESAPHEYVVADRTPGLTQADAARAAHVIRTFGQPAKFYKTTRIYLTTPMGWKHWDMQGGLVDDTEVRVINRCRVDHVYGPQNAPRTASGIESIYDGLATSWDTKHGMTYDERAQTIELIRESFGDNLGRTLDMGCATGWPLDAGLVDPVRYVGIDASTAMLNTLVTKHPNVAGLHPMTFLEARRRDVLCGTKFDTVLALGGSATYISMDEQRWLRAVTKGRMVLMHYAVENGQLPLDLDARTAAESSLTTTMHGTRQRQIGRFVATVLG
jgi:hypothetical protein